MTTAIEFYCDNCEKYQPVVIDDFESGIQPNPSGKYVSEICCAVCDFAIATIRSDRMGEVTLFVMVDVWSNP